MPNGMGKPVQQFVIWVSIAGEKWMRWSRLYDFTAGQFKKGIEAIVILINFPFLEGFKLWLVLDNLSPSPVYRITFEEDDLEGHLKSESDQNDNGLQ